MPDSPIVGLLQICPNDEAPFGALCRVYQKAAESLGLATRTIFLAPPRADRGDATYLDCDDLSATKLVAQRLSAAAGEVSECLVICHRYRAYRIYLNSELRAARTVAVAHEFGFFKRWRRRLTRRIIGRGVLFAGVSQAVADELRAAVGHAIVLSNALDLDAVGFLERDAARATLNLPADSWCCGYVGRLHYWKQPQLALQGFRRARKRIADSRLTFLGDGEMRSALEQQAAGLPVSFAGFVEEAARYVKAFDVMLMTSTAREAFGMVALEAMAAGVPVIAPRHPGPVSVLGDTGYYYDDPKDIAECLVTVARGGALLQERRRAGVLRAQQSFSVTALAARLDSLRYTDD